MDTYETPSDSANEKTSRNTENTPNYSTKLPDVDGRFLKEISFSMERYKYMHNAQYDIEMIKQRMYDNRLRQDQYKMSNYNQYIDINIDEYAKEYFIKQTMKPRSVLDESFELSGAL